MVSVNNMKLLKNKGHGMNKIDFNEGIAFCIILSVFAGLSATNLEITPNQKILSWIVFIIVSGATLNTIGMGLKKQLIASLIPSATFITTLLFILLVGYINGNPILGSIGFVDINDIQSKTGLDFIIFVVLFMIALFLVTSIGLGVSITAGGIFRKIVRVLLNLDPKDIGKTEKVFNSILRILIVIMAIAGVFK